MAAVLVHTKQPVQVGDWFAPATNRADRHQVIRVQQDRLGPLVTLKPEGAASGVWGGVSADVLLAGWVRV